MTRRWPAVAGVLAFTSVVVSLTVLSATTEEPQSAFERDGAGSAPLVEDASALGHVTQRLLTGPAALLHDQAFPPARTLLVVVDPKEPYSPDDAVAFRQFLEAGGRALLVDNFGQSNTLLMGSGLAFERVRVVDPGRLVVPVRLGAQEFEVRMPAPTAIHSEPSLSATIVANSTAQSFLDRDGDGIITAGDPPGPFALIASMDVGENGGRLVLVADPTPFLRSDGERLQDRDFRLALLEELLPQRGLVVLDESRPATNDPWLLTASVVTTALRTPPWNYVAVGLVLLVLGFGLFASSLRVWGPSSAAIDYFVRRAPPSEFDETTKETQKRRAPDVRWTLRGRLAIFGGVALALTGVAAGSHQATSAASFLLVTAALAMMVQPASANVQRQLSAAHTDEGRAVTAQLSLSRLHPRRAVLELRDELPREFELTKGHNWFTVGPSARAPNRVDYTFNPGLRGGYDIGPLRVRNTDLLGLRVIESFHGERSTINVRPVNHALNNLPFKSKSMQVTMGPHLVNRAGDGSEFQALRPYQQGDSIRMVNWRASARSKDIVVNQNVHESMAHVVVVIDARAVAGAGVAAHSPLNEACRAAISIASGALRVRDKVRIVTYGDGVRDLIDAPGPLDLHQISNALGALKAEGATSLEDALKEIIPSLRPRSPVILLSGLEADPSVVKGIVALRHRGMLPQVVALTIGTRPVRPDEGEPEPEAAKLESARDAMISELQAAGVPVVPGQPGTPFPILMRLGVGR